MNGLPAVAKHTVVNPSTGEIINLHDASTERLAQAVADLRELRTALAEFEGTISDAMVARLDADARWTQRFGPYEISAPSPTAGSETYPPDMLETQLGLLIANRTITPEAASGACKRQLVLTLEVPWGVDIHALAGNAKGVRFHIAGSDVHVSKAEAVLKAVAAGIAALRKVPGTRNALDAARVEGAPPARRVKITAKGRK
jgi:hypothetical protein